MNSSLSGESPSESRPLSVRCSGANCHNRSMLVVFVNSKRPYPVKAEFLEGMFSSGCMGCCQCTKCGAFYCYDCIDMDAPCEKCHSTSWAEGFYRPKQSSEQEQSGPMDIAGYAKKRLDEIENEKPSPFWAIFLENFMMFIVLVVLLLLYRVFFGG